MLRNGSDQTGEQDAGTYQDHQFHVYFIFLTRHHKLHNLTNACVVGGAIIDAGPRRTSNTFRLGSVVEVLMSETVDLTQNDEVCFHACTEHS